ncbi:MAG: hypothetical protein AAF985_15605 [Bacteroidota bacterium]
MIKKLLLFLLAALTIFVFNVLYSTGFFRQVDPLFTGEIVQKIGLAGAEDITISYQDSFAIISSTDRGVYPPSREEDGDLYLLDLKQGDYTSKKLTGNFPRPFAPHGISLVQSDSTYWIAAISHTLTGHSIELFELAGETLTHVRSYKDPALISPNDIVLLDQNRFYFTNDHGYTAGIGKFLEEYGGLAVSNVVYYDGSQYREVANGIAYANGINYDTARQLLFVSSPRGFLVKVYRRSGNGDLAFIEDIPCGTGVDNIEFDEEGLIWIGAHPDLLHFAAYAKGNKKYAPSEIITIDYQDKGAFRVEKVYVEDGQQMSASSVAASFGNLVFVGNVKDDHFLVLSR